MTEISSSDIVKSLAGHDTGSIYHVMSTSGGYAMLADGKIRRLQNQKRKKLKHLTFLARSDSPVAEKIKSGGMVTDSEIRKSLAACKLRHRLLTEEGN